MERKPPTPVCKSFVVCRHLWQDNLSQEWILAGPTHMICTTQYPTVADLSLFARFTSVQGRYNLELQLQDLEGTCWWRNPFPVPWELHDPLAVGTVNVRHLGVYFPQPGKYEFVLLANGDEVMRDVFFACVPVAPAPPS